MRSFLRYFVKPTAIIRMLMVVGDGSYSIDNIKVIIMLMVIIILMVIIMVIIMVLHRYILVVIEIVIRYFLSATNQL